MQIIPCAVRSAHLWLKSAKVELTSDSFAQPKQHVQSLVFPRLQRQISRNLLEDKDGNTKWSTKVAQQIWKDLLLEKKVEEPSEKRDLVLILKSFYVDARKKDGSSYSLRSLKTLRFALNWHFKAVQSFDIINDAEFSDANKVFQMSTWMVASDLSNWMVSSDAAAWWVCSCIAFHTVVFVYFP